MLVILAIAVLIIGISAVYILKNKKPKVEANSGPHDMKHLLASNIPYYSKLDAAMQQRFAQKAADFLAAVRIEGVGFELTDADKIMVAASAVIPILNFEGWNYSHLTNVIVYPDAFNNDFQFEGENRNIMGMVGYHYLISIGKLKAYALYSYSS